jgi:predicted Zn-dependent protease
MIQSQLERAQQLVTQQRYKDAETELRSILAQDPNNTQALALFAICLSELDRQPEAIQIIQSAIGQEPDNDYLLYLQSLFYFKADKLNLSGMPSRMILTMRITWACLPPSSSTKRNGRKHLSMPTTD